MKVSFASWRMAGHIFCGSTSAPTRTPGATVFVIDVKTSRRRNVRGSVDSFQRAGANVIGTVVNRVANKRSDYYYEYTRST